jgi:hypothetical protein
VFYLVAWLPYTLVAMYSVFINTPKITPIMGTIPALFAKTSLIWPAILNIIIQKKESKKMLGVLLFELQNLVNSSIN